MTVRCPRCGTLYRPPGRARPGASSTFRCARCRHVFDGTADEPKLMTAVGERTDDEPAFTFGDQDAEEDDEPPAASPAASPATRGAPTPARFALRALLAVTVGYATLSVYLYTHPDRTRQLLEQIPLLGPTLAERRLHPDSIQLADVQGEYQRVKGDRLVFVISGTAVNGSPVAVRGIQIEGRISGGTEQRPVVFCGAAPRDVHDLSLREISLLQTLEPPKDWALAPGDQATFMIVFAGPPPDLHEFAAEVVAVQAPGRVGARSEDSRRVG